MIKIHLLPLPPPSFVASLLAGRTFLPLLIAAAAISASLFPALGAAFELRPELAAFQPWRLFTCHLAHWNEQHLMWDLLAFLALAPLLEARRLAAILLPAGLAIAAGVLIWHPELAAYRGLSGLDAALFAALALDLARRDSAFDRGLGRLALLLLGAKIVTELASGDAVFVATGGAFAPVPLAHLLGLAAAFCEATGRRRKSRQRGPAAAAELCHNAPP